MIQMMHRDYRDYRDLLYTPCEKCQGTRHT